MKSELLAFYSDMVEEEGKSLVLSYDLSGDEATHALSPYIDLSSVNFVSLHCDEYETGIKSITARIMNTDSQFQEKRLLVFQDVCLVDMSVVEMKKSIVQLLNPNISPQKIHESRRNIHETSVSFGIPGSWMIFSELKHDKDLFYQSFSTSIVNQRDMELYYNGIVPICVKYHNPDLESSSSYDVSEAFYEFQRSKERLLLTVRDYVFETIKGSRRNLKN